MFPVQYGGNFCEVAHHIGSDFWYESCEIIAICWDRIVWHNLQRRVFLQENRERERCGIHWPKARKIKIHSLGSANSARDPRCRGANSRDSKIQSGCAGERSRSLFGI